MPRVLYAFLCEDLRIEASGQTTAVGMWGTRIEMSELPGQLRSIGFHVQVHNPERQPYPTHLQLQGPFAEGFGPIEHRGVLPVTDPGNGSDLPQGATINLIVTPVPLAGPGRIVATLTIESDPPISVGVELDVVKGIRTRITRVPAEPNTG